MIVEQPARDIDRKLRRASVVVTWIGIATVLAAGVQPSQGMAAVLNAAPLVLWALFPFGLSLLGLLGKQGGIVRSIGILGTSGFGLLAYCDLLFGRPSSTEGLAFLFIPFWHLLACGALLLVTTAETEPS